jgi:hypothetical protein
VFTPQLSKNSVERVAFSLVHEVRFVSVCVFLCSPDGGRRFFSVASLAVAGG